MKLPGVKDSSAHKPIARRRCRKRVVENDEYGQFARRILVAYGRRVASGDIEAIAAMCALSDDLDKAIRLAVAGLHGFGYSWADVASRLGISRQAAHLRYGTPPVIHSHPHPPRPRGRMCLCSDRKEGSHMKTPVVNPRSGLGWAVLGSWVGGGLSLAANIGQSLIRPDNVSPEQWHVDGWNVGIGVAAPVVLFIALEIIIKPHWWLASRAARRLVTLGFLPIALGAGMVSYDHMYELLVYKHQPMFACIVIPLMPDGLMVMSTVAQRFIRRLTINTSAPFTPAPTVVTAEPSTPDRPTVGAVNPPAPARPVVPAPTAPPSPVAVSANRPRSVTAAAQPSPSRSKPTVAKPITAPRTDISVTAPGAATVLDPPAARDLLARAAKFAAEHRAKTGSRITPGELAVRLRVPSPRAAQLLDQVDFTDPTTVARVNGSKP